MTCLLITRPEPQAERTSRQLEHLGFTVLSAPMLSVAYHEGAAAELRVAEAAEAPQAIIITSQHAAQVLKQVPEATRHKILTVGPASAEAVQEAGARDVEGAGGDAESLLLLIRKRLQAGKGPLIYLRAEDIAADIPGKLRADGFQVIEILTYEARPVEHIPPETAQALLEKRVDGVLFFSSRTAEIFLEVAAGQGMMPSLIPLIAVVTSEAIAKLMRRAGWTRIEVVKLGDPAQMEAGVQKIFRALPEESSPPLLEAAIEPGAEPVTPVESSPAEPAEGTRPSSAAAKGFVWVGLGVVLALAALLYYAYARHSSAMLNERPSRHHFVTRADVVKPGDAAMPAIAENADHPETAPLPEKENSPSPAAGPAEMNAAPSPKSSESASNNALPPKTAETTPGSQAPDKTNEALVLLQRQLDDQGSRIEALEQALEQQKKRSATADQARDALIKLAHLRNKVLAGKPYGSELSDLTASEGASAELRESLLPLQENAESGISTVEGLKTAFQQALRIYESAPSTQDGAKGVWAETKAKIASLITIRKIGANQTGSDDGAVIARTEAAVNAGDFDHGLHEIAEASPQGAPYFVEFRKAARQRVKAAGLLRDAERSLDQE